MPLPHDPPQTNARTIKVVLIDSEGTRNRIYKVLVYRKDCRGRALNEPILDLHLKKWDRIIATPTLTDVSKFEKMEIPFEAKFWRMSKHDRVFHDCPLLEIEDSAGFGYSDWCVDILHGWALGPLGALIAKTLTVCVCVCEIWYFQSEISNVIIGRC